MCEDYPCCGHTNEDPCGVQWYDAPDAFDTSVNPHALCDHENGDCDVDEYGDDEIADPETCTHSDGRYSEGAGFHCDLCCETFEGPRTKPDANEYWQWGDFWVN